MSKTYNIIVEKDEEGWLVSEVVELPGCHTQAKSMDQLIERTKEAIKAYIEDHENGDISPEFIGIKQSPGLLGKIIKKDLGMTREEFMKYV